MNIAAKMPTHILNMNFIWIHRLVLALETSGRGHSQYNVPRSGRNAPFLGTLSMALTCILQVNKVWGLWAPACSFVTGQASKF